MTRSTVFLASILSYSWKRFNNAEIKKSEYPQILGRKQQSHFDLNKCSILCDFPAVRITQKSPGTCRGRKEHTVSCYHFF